MFIRNKPKQLNQGPFFRCPKFGHDLIWTCHEDGSKKGVSN